jgi:hypothetical protein
MGIAGYVSVCLQLYCMLVSLSFTTYFGLHGHLQVCRILHIFIFICLRILFAAFFSRGYTLQVFHLCFVPVLFSFVFLQHLASRRKKHEGEQHRNKTQMENRQSVTMWEKKAANKKKKSSETESLNI